MADLVVVTPDGAYPQVVGELLKRHQSLQIRPVSTEWIKDPWRDSSGQIVTLLRPYLGICDHALVLRDLSGSGRESDGATGLEQKLRNDLQANGWNESNSDAIVVEPEIEDWLRLPSAALCDLVKERARRQKDRAADPLAIQRVVHEKLRFHGGLDARGKARKPKEVFEDVLRDFGIPRANALYGALARSESLHNCASVSFNRLVTRLQGWFPASQAAPR